MANHSVYVKKEIWGLELPVIHRCLLAQIEYFTERDGYCTSTNEQISMELLVSKAKIGKTIKELSQIGLIKSIIKRSSAPMWNMHSSVVSSRKLVCMPLDDFSEIYDSFITEAQKGED